MTYWQKITFRNYEIIKLYLPAKIDTMNNGQTLKEKIDNTKSVDFGKVLEDCFNLFKKVWLNGFLLVIIVAVISFGVSFLFQVLGMNYTINNFTFDSFNDFFTIYSSQLIYNIPISLITTFSTFILLAGFYKSCKEADKGKNKTELIFYFFKKEYLSKIALLSVIYAAITIIAQALFLFPIIYAFVPLMYFIVLFAFNPESSIGEIVEQSFIFGTKKWFVTFGSVILMTIIAMFGIIACFIGLLFTVSLAYLPAYIIYRDSIGFEDEFEVNS